MTKKISLTDTAKIIRQELKDKFPKTKFSVRSERYSMGASINVIWQDGYSLKQVEDVVKRFACKGKMQVDDYVPYVNDTWEGQEVRWGSDYVNCKREISEYYWDKVFDQFDAVEDIFLKDASDYLEAYKYYKDTKLGLESFISIKKTYVRRILNQLDFHGKDWKQQPLKIQVEAETLRAMCLKLDKEQELEQGLYYFVTKVKYVEFSLSQKCVIDCDRTVYIHNDIAYSEDWFEEYQEHKIEVIPDLIIDGVILEGKIADYARANGLESESLESLVTSFYSQSDFKAETGNGYQLVHNTDLDKLQFIFDAEPSPYVQSVLETRGFQGTGTLYQRELNKISIYAAGSVTEAIQNF